MKKYKNIDWLAGMRVLLCAHYIPGPVGASFLQNMGQKLLKLNLHLEILCVHFGHF